MPTVYGESIASTSRCRVLAMMAAGDCAPPWVDWQTIRYSGESGGLA
ncbi:MULTISPECIES: hypothetical protein [Microvirgula]|nr:MULTISPECIES: hypothetical protein [Microvirgula]